MERVDGKAAGDHGFITCQRIGLADGERADAIPDAAGGEGGHGVAKPDPVIHRYISNRLQTKQSLHLVGSPGQKVMVAHLLVACWVPWKIGSIFVCVIEKTFPKAQDRSRSAIAGALILLTSLLRTAGSSSTAAFRLLSSQRLS